MKDISLYENVPLLKNKFQVKFMPSYRSCYLPPHWHEHTEMIFILSGSCRYTLSGRTFTAKKGDFVAANSTEIHSFTADGSFTYHCLMIYPDFFADVEFSGIRIKNIIHNDAEIAACFEAVDREYTSGGIGSDMMIKSHTYRLMAYLARNFSVPAEKSSEAQSDVLRRVNLLLGYISKHYNEKITSAQLSKLCFLSESYFCRFFRKAIGKSVTEYINEFRVEKAAVMLKNTDDTVTDIAAKSGFDDVNYFSRCFRRIKNTSPSSFRLEHGEDNASS